MIAIVKKDVSTSARRSSNAGTDVKGQADGDPLDVLHVVASSMESIQEVIDTHPHLNSIEYYISGGSRKRRDKQNHPKEHKLSLIKGNCANYREKAEDTSRELMKISGEHNSSGSARQLVSSMWNQRKLKPYKGQLQQMLEDLHDYLRRSLTVESSEIQKCLQNISTKLLSAESKALNKQREMLKDRESDLVSSLKNDGIRIRMRF